MRRTYSARRILFFRDKGIYPEVKSREDKMSSRGPFPDLIRERAVAISALLRPEAPVFELKKESTPRPKPFYGRIILSFPDIFFNNAEDIEQMYSAFLERQSKLFT